MSKADCLFIYAATACRFIASTDWEPQERLHEVLQSHTSKNGITAHLDNMYLQVLRSALIRDRHEEDVRKLCNRFRQVVGCIVVLSDELSISSLAKLLGGTAETVEGCLRTLHSVLDVPNRPQVPIRILHPSFRDFLLTQSRCYDERFCVDKAMVHARLVSCCLNVISSELKRNWCRLPTPGSSPQDLPRGAIDECLPSHVQYACYYWVDHLLATGPSLRTEIGFHDEGKVHDFFRKDLLHWLEAMCLLCSMSQAVLMMTWLVNVPEVSEYSCWTATPGAFGE